MSRGLFSPDEVVGGSKNDRNGAGTTSCRSDFVPGSPRRATAGKTALKPENGRTSGLQLRNTRMARMGKEKGANCGSRHPKGSGPMVQGVESSGTSRLWLPFSIRDIRFIRSAGCSSFCPMIREIRGGFAFQAGRIPVSVTSTDRIPSDFMWSAAAGRRWGAATCRGPGKRGHARALQKGPRPRNKVVSTPFGQ